MKHNIHWKDLKPEEEFYYPISCDELTCRGMCEICLAKDNTCLDYPKQCEFCITDCPEKDDCIEKKKYEGCCRTCAGQEPDYDNPHDPSLQFDDDLRKPND